MKSLTMKTIMIPDFHHDIRTQEEHYETPCLTRKGLFKECECYLRTLRTHSARSYSPHAELKQAPNDNGCNMVTMGLFTLGKIPLGLRKYFVSHFNPLNPRVKPLVVQSFLTFDSMERTIIWKGVEQYFHVLLFALQLFFKIYHF